MISPSSSSTTTSTTRSTLWTIRPAQLQDGPKVNELLKASYETLLAKDYKANILETVLPKICNANENLLTCGTWYVVHPTDDPNRLVGCGGWTPHSPLAKTTNKKNDNSKEEQAAPPSFPHLRHFATDPNCARQGIGRLIWNRSWKDLCEYYQNNNENNNGCDEISPPTAMEVLSTITAEPFYASLGFEKITDMTLPFGENCDFPCILMRQNIDIPAASADE